MRVVVLFALSTGTVLEAAMGKYRGKLTAEVSLFREVDKIIGKDDHSIQIEKPARPDWMTQEEYDGYRFHRHPRSQNQNREQGFSHH